MRWKREVALAGALMLMGAMATATVAQPRDRWELLGERSVSFRVDRDVVDIGQNEDWFRNRSYKALHLVAERNDIYLMRVRLVYFNGFAEEYTVDRLIRQGEDLPVDLRGERSFLRRIEMIYRSRPDFRGEAIMKIYGEFGRRFAGPPGPPPLPSGPPPGPGPEAWVELGCQQVSLFGKDHDTVRVGRQEGRFRAIRLHVRGADVEMLDLKVIYANGTPDDIPVRNVIRQGERTRPLDLMGWERLIDRVDMVYRTIPNFKGLATVCVEGRA